MGAGGTWRYQVAWSSDGEGSSNPLRGKRGRLGTIHLLALLLRFPECRCQEGFPEGRDEGDVCCVEREMGGCTGIIHRRKVRSIVVIAKRLPHIRIHSKSRGRYKQLATAPHCTC
jgi:hypothetical protein